MASARLARVEHQVAPSPLDPVGEDCLRFLGVTRPPQHGSGEQGGLVVLRPEAPGPTEEIGGLFVGRVVNTVDAVEARRVEQLGVEAHRILGARSMTPCLAEAQRGHRDKADV